MADRYYSDQPVTGTSAQLDGAEAHHLAHVMRAKPGDPVILFDGTGQEFDAQVRNVGRSSIQCQIVAARHVDRELPVRLTLAVALPKGDRQRWLVEKAVELGVTSLVPLITQRGVAQPAVRALERLRRAVVEAAKQCGRNRLMTIDPPQNFAELVEQTPATVRRIVAHPQGDVRFLPPAASDPSDWICAIGPEGGFTNDEAALAAAHGWQTISLGPRILRVETAALYLASLIAAAHIADVS